MLARTKDELGFPVGEVGTVAQTAAQTSVSILEWIKQKQTFFHLVFIAVQKRGGFLN